MSVKRVVQIDVESQSCIWRMTCAHVDAPLSFGNLVSPGGDYLNRIKGRKNLPVFVGLMPKWMRAFRPYIVATVLRAPAAKSQKHIGNPL
jgi:hypothetical protein